MIAVMDSGVRIRFWGYGDNPETFDGELLDPTERELRLGAHISCMWERSKIALFEREEGDPPLSRLNSEGAV